MLQPKASTLSRQGHVSFAASWELHRLQHLLHLPRCVCICRPRTALPSFAAPQGSADGHDIIEAGLRSTASMFATIPATGASMDEVNAAPGAKHDFKPLETYAEGSNSVSSYQGPVASDSDNVGGVRAAITNKLGSSLSYRASFKVRPDTLAAAQWLAAAAATMPWQQHPACIWVCAGVLHGWQPGERPASMVRCMYDLLSSSSAFCAALRYFTHRAMTRAMLCCAVLCCAGQQQPHQGPTCTQCLSEEDCLMGRELLCWSVMLHVLHSVWLQQCFMTVWAAVHARAMSVDSWLMRSSPA